MSILTVRAISKTYGSRFGAAARRALDKASLDIEEREFVAILGPSGSGKSTLLNMIALLDSPDSGEILFRGENPRSGGDLATFRRKHIGFVFQDSNLIDTMTVRENILLPLALDKAPAIEARARVAELASALGIADILDAYPVETSGGQRQRSSAARALVLGPSLLLADEPTGALDSRSARDLLERFRALNEERGSAILMVTHDPFAASWSDRAVFLRDGRPLTTVNRTADRKEFLERILAAQAAADEALR